MLNQYDFGKKLLETKDLDPIYVMLHEAKLPERMLKKWCLAYWCFYHAGVASAIAETSNYYHTMVRAYDEKWPRGSERRHFRGPKALNSIRYLACWYPDPCSLVDQICAPADFNSLKDFVKSIPLFGDWVTFKIADMRDRVLGEPLECSPDDLAIYKVPKEGASVAGYSSLSSAIHDMERFFHMYEAPPRYDRKVNIYEIETILCKYKSYRNGKYEIGHDINEIAHHLSGWGKTAEYLQTHLPEKVL